MENLIYRQSSRRYGRPRSAVQGGQRNNMSKQRPMSSVTRVSRRAREVQRNQVVAKMLISVSLDPILIKIWHLVRYN